MFKKTIFAQKKIADIAKYRRFLLIFILTFTMYLNSLAQFYCDFSSYFVPTTNDPVLYVKVKVHIFHLSQGGGVWQGTTTQDIQDVIDAVNVKLSNILAPTCTISGTPYIPNAKIQLTLTGAYNVNDNTAYGDLYSAHLGYTSSFAPATIYHDASHLNIFFGLNGSDINYFTDASIPYDTPGNFIGITTNTVYNYKDDRHILILAHEVGHILGLTHADNSEWYPSLITLNNVHCCQISKPVDYCLLPYTGHQCGPGNTNNLMAGDDIGCIGYLSPGQISIMRYHLLTMQPSWLTSASYTEATTAAAVHDLTVASTATWTTPRFYKGNVTIPSGVKLTIKCMVAMQHNGKFIVEPGGQLVIDGGEITNISGRLWGGIDVRGQIALDQSFNPSTGFASHQGVLIMKNGAVLRNSINGVRNYGYLSDGVTHDTGSNGGIIRAENSQFINNVRDVEFLYCPMTSVSASRFDNCEFIADGSPIGDGNAPYVHVTLYSIKGVQFNGCKFENKDAYANTGEGIHSSDAIYTVKELNSSTPSQFITLNKGVSVYNPNPLRPVNVFNSEFKNNNEGVVMSSVHSNFITNNSFTVGNQPFAISVNNCKNYAINSNTITNSVTQTAYGIFASYSGAGAHTIYRNTFKNLLVGINSQYDNSGETNALDGLKANCNIFNSASLNMYDIVMLGAGGSNANMYPSVAKWQGNPDPSPLTKVRNQYGAGCATGSSQRKWYVAVVKKDIQHPANNSPAAMQPTPQPACSNPTVIITPGPAFDFSAHCSGGSGFQNGQPIVYSSLATSISNAKASANTLSLAFLDSIDGGNTSGVLHKVNDPTLSAEEKHLLLSNSSPYLSDEVMLAYFSSTRTAVTDVFTIHAANKPVSALVWQAILEREFDPSILTELEINQSETNISERDILEGNLVHAKFVLQESYSEMLAYFLHDTLVGSQDSVIKMLSENVGALPDTKVLLAQAYIDAGYSERAFAYADSLLDVEGFEEIMALQIALMKLDTSSKKLFAIPDESALQTLLESYAGDSLKKGSWRARAALNCVFGSPMNFTYLSPPMEEESERSASKDESLVHGIEVLSSDKNLLQIYPNPSNQNFKMIYNSSEKLEFSYIVRDILGKEIISGIIKPNIETEIDGKHFSNGIYFVTLIQDGRIVEKRKQIIMK